MKMISLFNHKGGVSKTTTTFNLGWMLAEQGYKILIVDTDPQCNLTALVLGYSSIDDTSEFYAKNPNCDLYTCILPVLNGEGRHLDAAPVATAHPNLSLLCGNLQLSEAETQISVALTTAAKLPAMRNIPGVLGACIRSAATKNDFDYVLVDMSPSVGALNQCLLMSSDYFIVPTAPDFFCAQAIKSLTRVVPKWNKEVSDFRDSSFVYHLPENPPKFIGIISQKYRPRNGAPAKSFQRWIDIINSEVANALVPALVPFHMCLDDALFKSFSIEDEPYNLANIADFNSLIAQAQKHNVPVFALTDDQIEQGGNILDNMKLSRDDFGKTFYELSLKVVGLTA
ncbi:ParA family protein [Pseudomonas syringae]|uniref:AAA family ATPase n=4 Tax=Pseudomonas syringae TaxID=317 RepID=A0A9Q4A9E1_PSESX|nr:ParA family protein [Pseudomonas syringae]MCF5467180.1 AAA family ATPase [Pseudomonas syringae]MCF5472185.1 AAA family ATPase [Pseudomonas syringae]MCF5481837.1 AAA family ATPase [Pseudomonas syringae]MCF5496031.1 AAA family ATPase [Pseudomonas syringae]MCF5504973.1 AAA family ATPase [Pseudomonas syringae]